MSEKPGIDPKGAVGLTKPQLHLNPPAGSEEQAKALACGAAKYGVFNWRKNRVKMQTYLAAMKRHIDRLMDGESIDPESGAHHLGHVMAGCSIVLDAERHGTLDDDRVLPPGLLSKSDFWKRQSDKYGTPDLEEATAMLLADKMAAEGERP